MLPFFQLFSTLYKPFFWGKPLKPIRKSKARQRTHRESRKSHVKNISVYPFLDANLLIYIYFTFILSMVRQNTTKIRFFFIEHVFLWRQAIVSSRPQESSGHRFPDTTFLLKVIPPVLIQMLVVHKPFFKLSQLRA